MEKGKRKYGYSIKAILLLGLVFLCLFSFVLPPMSFFASASETSVVDFDKTNVLDDLMSSDESIVSKFPPNENADPKIQIIQIVEYCYSYKESSRGNFGLYVYVYNPTNLSIVEDSKSNQIQIAVKYDAETIVEDSYPLDFEKFDLEFLNKSSGEYENLYYKYKIVDHKSSDGKTISQRVNSALRRYDISSIELLTAGHANPHDYSVSRTFIFTGFAKGLGINENSENSLSCKSKQFDVVDLDVKHSFYRTKTSSKGYGWHNQIDSVYFRVPERFFTAYGTLQRIKAEWYEFVTRDIVVTSLKNFYNSVFKFIGKQIGNNILDKKDCAYFMYDKLIDGFSNTSWSWNSPYSDAPNVDALYYLFYVDNFGDYDPSVSVNFMGGISSEDLCNYICSYDKSFDNGVFQLGDFGISADLFEKDIQDDRKIDNEVGKIQSGFSGKSYYDFDASLDLISLMSWSGSDRSFWDDSSNWGFFNALFGSIPKEDNIFDISPIYIVSDSDVAMSDNDIIDKLFVNADDVQALKADFNLAKLNHEKLVLFRFAKSDYLSKDVNILEPLNSFQTNIIYDRAYRTKQTIFLNFDIIQLTFSKDLIFYSIPVVADPIDVVDAVTPPVKTPDWWQSIVDFFKNLFSSWWKILVFVVVIIALIALLPVIFPFLLWLFKALIMIVWYVLKGVWWLITLPFKIFKKDN